MGSGVGQISVLHFTYRAVTLVVSKGVGCYVLGRMWKAVDELGDLAAGSVVDGPDGNWSRGSKKIN